MSARVTAPEAPAAGGPGRRAGGAGLWLNVGVKLLLLALLLFAVLAPDLPRFAGKAMEARALTYPIVAMVLPLIWSLRGRRGRYPHLADALLVLPFAVDTAGNALDLFDTVNHFDELAHGLNWALLTAAFGAAVAPSGIGRANAAALAVGFGPRPTCCGSSSSTWS